MKVSELFYSIQGEGPSAGVPAVFLRVPKCNLHCNGLWKCDSQEVMKTSTEMSYQDIKAFTVGMGLYEDIFMGDVHFVITGGEPLFKDQALEIMNLLDYLKPGYSELETNGTIFNRPLLERVSQVNCSPKLESSGISIQKRRNNNFFRWAAKAPNVIFKFVIASAHDFAEVYHSKLKEIFKDIPLTDSPEWDSLKTQEDIFNWIDVNITYSTKDTSVVSPAVTLERGWGDCKAFTLLYMNMSYRVFNNIPKMAIATDRTIVEGGGPPFHTFIYDFGNYYEPQTGNLCYYSVGYTLDFWEVFKK